jgi:hypothetical protein
MSKTSRFTEILSQLTVMIREIHTGWYVAEWAIEARRRRVHTIRHLRPTNESRFSGNATLRVSEPELRHRCRGQFV